MNKSDIKFYSTVLINADIDFLIYQIGKRGVTLIPNMGLQKLIDECEAYLLLPPDSEIYNTTIKPLLVLYSLSDTLRMLWLKKKDFGVQLSAMNSGSYEYGVLIPGQNNFKDFELEIFSAAYLNQFGVKVDLPQNTVGNDIVYNEIEIQCKHPEVFKREKIEYQYHLKDHLGNVRTTVTSQQHVIEFKVNYEDDTANPDDMNLFEEVQRSSVWDFNATSGAYADNTEYTHSQILYSSPHSQVGSILAIPVGKGDSVNASVMAKYISAAENTSLQPITIAAALISAFTGSVTGTTEFGSTTINNNYGSGSLIGTGSFSYNSSAPKVFLNMIFLSDKEVEIIDQNRFTYDQINQSATESIIGDNQKDPFDELTTFLKAPSNGFIIIYVSNEGSMNDVFFDDMHVTITESPVIQAEDYYPFGLQFNSYSRVTAKQNNFKYNGFEQQEALDWNVYDYQARYYDPVIGRFLQVDPAADLMRRYTPYAYAFNNPIRFIDPDGMIPTDPQKEMSITSSENRDVITETVTTTTTTTRTVQAGTDEYYSLLGKSTITGNNGIGDEISVTETSTTTVETSVTLEYDDQGNVTSRNEAQSTNSETKTNVTVSDQFGGDAGGFTTTSSSSSSNSAPSVSDELSSFSNEASNYRAENGISITNKGTNAERIARQKSAVGTIDAINTTISVLTLPVPKGRAFPLNLWLYSVQKGMERAQKGLETTNKKCDNCTINYSFK